MKTIYEKLIAANNFLQNVEIKGSASIMSLGNALIQLQESIKLIEEEILNQEKPKE